MLSPKDSHRGMEDTSSSFNQFKIFEYHDSGRTIDYHLLQQGHAQALHGIFINGDKVTEEEVTKLFERSLEENNLFVQQVLEQLTEECRKNRYQKEYYEKLLRKISIEERKHSEQMVILTNKIQAVNMTKSKETQVFLRKIQETSIEKQQLLIELEGLKTLVAQYENQLNRLNTGISKKNAEYEKKNEVQTKLSNEIINLKKQIQKGQLMKLELNAKISKQQSDQKDKDSIILKLSRENTDLIDFKNKYESVLQEQVLFKEQLSQKDILIEHLEIELLKTNGICAKMQLELKQFNDISKDIGTNNQNRDKEWKLKFSQLQEKTKLNMLKLKEIYQIKTKKLLTILRKEITSLKSFASKTNLSIQKQLLLGWKLIKNDLLRRDK